MVPVALWGGRLSSILPIVLAMMKCDGRPPLRRRASFAGRDRQKLELVRAEVGIDVDLLVADSQDRTAIDSIVSQTRVLLNTAGPFALYGDAIVDTCVRYRTLPGISQIRPALGMASVCGSGGEFGCNCWSDSSTAAASSLEIDYPSTWEWAEGANYE